MSILLELPPTEAHPVEFEIVVNRQAAIKMTTSHRQIVLMGNPLELAAKLRELAAKLEPHNGKPDAQIVNSLPDLPPDPHTAWPWLVSRLPWLFDGINLSAEPYAHYLKDSTQQADNQLSADVQALLNCSDDLFTPDGTLQRGYTRKAAAVLFGDESLNGGNYLKRIKAAIETLQTQQITTTTPAQTGDYHAQAREAA